MKHLSFILIAIISFTLILPVLVSTVNAQPQQNVYVTVNPTTSDTTFYTRVNHNFTFSFQALWSYGDDAGKPVQNAIVKMEILNQQNQVIGSLKLNTTTGFFLFNYSSINPDILTFTPASLTLQDGTEYTVAMKDSSLNLYGLQAKSVTVWYDSFHVSIVNMNTDSLGKVTATVNVTYQLLPEDGLTLAASATYSQQTFLPKNVQNATVLINGVKATETQPGIYTAESSLIMPTAYVNVQVSQEGWTPTVNAFSTTHTANEQVWLYAATFISALSFAAVGLHFALARKASHNNSSLKPSNWPFIGGVLLAASSIVSFYWGLTGIEGSMHLFDWLFLTILALASFVLGLVGAALAIKGRNQALTIFASILPLLTNVVIVKTSLDTYMLPYSWITLLAPAALSIASIVAISNFVDTSKKQLQL